MTEMKERKCVYRDRKESVFTVTERKEDESMFTGDRKESVFTVTAKKVCLRDRKESVFIVDRKKVYLP